MVVLDYGLDARYSMHDVRYSMPDAREKEIIN
jgi:hypothetical protein